MLTRYLQRVVRGCVLRGCELIRCVDKVSSEVDESRVCVERVLIRGC